MCVQACSAQPELSHSLNCFVLCAFQTMTDVVGNPEEERRAEFYFQPWAQEAVCRYFYSKVSVPKQMSPSVPGGSAYLSLLFQCW